MIGRIHEHDIFEIALEIEPGIIGGLELRPINIAFDPIGYVTRQAVHKHMDEFVFVNALSDFLVDVKPKSADYVIFDIWPAVGDESEALKLGLLDEVAKLVGIRIVKDKLLTFLLNLLFSDRFHVLELLLAKDDERNWFD